MHTFQKFLLSQSGCSPHFSSDTQTLSFDSSSPGTAGICQPYSSGHHYCHSTDSSIRSYLHSYLPRLRRPAFAAHRTHTEHYQRTIIVCAYIIATDLHLSEPRLRPRFCPSKDTSLLAQPCQIANLEQARRYRVSSNRYHPVHRRAASNHRQPDC